MLHLILFRPEIPQNTGNIGRLCAITKSRLHLIHPLGFEINDRQIKRSGMDYWKSLDIHEHKDWESFAQSKSRPERLWLCTTKAKKNLWDADFKDGDGLVFGSESSGCPQWLHDILKETKITIPQFDDNLRSLNLSTAAGIVTYEALRQTSN